MYEKSRCIANIYDVAKKKNIKIGDLEESCGVSRGYLSRVNKPDYIGSPSIEVLDAIAARLGVGLDYIVSFDKNVYDEDDRFLLKLFDKLQRQTDSVRLEWVRETEDILINSCSGRIKNPLMRFVSSSEQNDNPGGHYEYKSSFMIGRALVNGDCYHANLHDGGKSQKDSFIYLNSIAYVNGDERYPSIEFYVVNEDNVYPICSSAFMRSAPKTALMKLYSSAEMFHGENKIIGAGRNILERYISRTD